MRYSKAENWAKHIDFMLIDIICIEAALLLANIIRYGWNLGLIFTSSYTRLSVSAVIIFVCLIFFMEPYSGILRRGYLRELTSVIIVNVVLALSMTAFFFVARIGVQYSRIMFLGFAILNICIMFAAHVCWKRWIRKRTNYIGSVTRLIVVTGKESVEKCVDQLIHTPYGTVSLTGIVMPGEAQDGSVESVQQIPVVCGEDQLVTYCKNNVVDAVLFYDCQNQQKKYTETLVDMGIQVYVNLAQAEDNYLRYCVKNVNGIVTLSTSIYQASAWQKMLKRAMDIAGGIVGCLITLVLFIFVAPIIKIQSPGPVFFAQQRVGVNGRQFKIYKFRSMYMDAEDRKKELMSQNKMKGFMFKMDNDPRVFPFGKIMRKTSIDEFPQFWNVLKGDMSLCGTRPPTYDEYTNYLPRHKSRLATKPGITGLWQISGRSDITDFEEVVRLDKEYIRNWSISLDIKILALTVITIFKQKGAV